LYFARTVLASKNSTDYSPLEGCPELVEGRGGKVSTSLRHQAKYSSRGELKPGTKI